MYNQFQDSPENIALRYSLWFSKRNTTNEAETSAGKLYYIHLHSQWVGIHVIMAQNLIFKRYPNPLKLNEHAFCSNFVNWLTTVFLSDHSDQITQDFLPSLNVYPRLCIVRQDDHRHAAMFPSGEHFTLAPAHSPRVVTKTEILTFAGDFLRHGDSMMLQTEQF